MPKRNKGFDHVDGSCPQLRRGRGTIQEEARRKSARIESPGGIWGQGTRNAGKDGSPESIAVGARSGETAPGLVELVARIERSEIREHKPRIAQAQSGL